jgi:hypothetical protein
LSDIVVFHLKRFWNHRDLWLDIIRGDKTSEWRDASPFWIKYFKNHNPRKAWFVVGYPKGNLPRLEADIISVTRPNRLQFEIKFENVRQVNTQPFSSVNPA